VLHIDVSPQGELPVITGIKKFLLVLLGATFPEVALYLVWWQRDCAIAHVADINKRLDRHEREHPEAVKRWDTPAVNDQFTNIHTILGQDESLDTFTLVLLMYGWIRL
jgi:hypothetical protein